jgi:hypothetical protein
MEVESSRMGATLKSMENELNQLRQIACVDPVSTDLSPDLIEVLDDVWKEESFEALKLRLENYDGDASCAYIDLAIRRGDRSFTDLKLKMDLHEERLDLVREFHLVLLEAREDPTGGAILDFMEDRIFPRLADWAREFRDQNRGNIVVEIFTIVVFASLVAMTIRSIFLLNYVIQYAQRAPILYFSKVSHSCRYRIDLESGFRILFSQQR